MSAKHRVLIAGLLAAGLAGVAGRNASAYIDPNFTPVQVVKQSSLVVELEFKSLKGAKGEAAVKRVLKGKLAAGKISFDFSTCAVKEHVELLEQRIDAEPHTQAVFFVGKFQEKGGEGAPAGLVPAEHPPGEAKEGGPELKAYLFVNGTWTAFYEDKDGTWGMDDTSAAMQGTWQGGGRHAPAGGRLHPRRRRRISACHGRCQLGRGEAVRQGFGQGSCRRPGGLGR
jgi:hypothetical protein